MNPIGFQLSLDEGHPAFEFLSAQSNRKASFLALIEDIVRYVPNPIDDYAEMDDVKRVRKYLNIPEPAAEVSKKMINDIRVLLCDSKKMKQFSDYISYTQVFYRYAHVFFTPEEIDKYAIPIIANIGTPGLEDKMDTACLKSICIAKHDIITCTKGHVPSFYRNEIEPLEQEYLSLSRILIDMYNDATHHSDIFISTDTANMLREILLRYIQRYYSEHNSQQGSISIASGLVGYLLNGEGSRKLKRVISLSQEAQQSDSSSDLI